MYIYIINILWLYLVFYQFNSLCLNFIHLLARKPICSIFSNKFFHNFHLSESVLLVKGFGQVVWREDWFKSYLFICNFASFINYEWANDYWLWPCEQFLKIYHGENKITFCWDDNTCFVQDHAAHQVWFLYTSLARMKKKPAHRKTCCSNRHQAHYPWLPVIKPLFLHLNTKMLCTKQPAVLEMKIWIFWSESNSWSYFVYI
jgi:hypothetical protein